MYPRFVAHCTFSGAVGWPTVSHRLDNIDSGSCLATLVIAASGVRKICAVLRLCIWVTRL